MRSVALAERSREAYVKATIRSLFPANFGGDREGVVQRAIELGLETPLEGISGALKGMSQRPDRYSAAQSDSTYLIAGKNDPVLPWESLLPLAEMIPHERKWINDGGHMAMFEDPAGLTAKLISFLQG
jgi:pimeloyl-ACP methyl ester carboxylesterase